MQIHELITQSESLTVEYKSDRKRLSDDELLSTVVCMANAEGGVLLVGVEDDGTPSGLHPSHQSRPELLTALIANRTVPPLTVQTSFERIAEVSVAVVQIPASVQPVATTDGRLLIRYLNTHGEPGCRPLFPHELSSWYADRGQADYTAQAVIGASWEDLDALEFARLRRMVANFRGDAALLELTDMELARALGLTVTMDQRAVPTVAGLLLVGQEQALHTHIPAHEVGFQVLRESDVLVNDFYRWPLLHTLERILDAFQIRNEERELNVGLFRVGIPAYDPRGFREAVNNALVHRDYQRLGAVHVQLRQDRIVISNPGGFVQGVRPSNLLVVDPKPRNPRLADCFKRIGLVERTGRGVGIIFSGQLRNGRPAPSYDRSTETSVSVTLYGGPADLDMVQLLVAEENRQQRTFTVGELLILDHVYREREIQTSTAVALTQQPEPEVRSILERLVEMGLLERRGARRSRSYHLSAGIYRDLGQPEAYVRMRGFEPLQMEQMVLQYVQAHGRITRSETAELCRINLNQAEYLLRQLVDRGDLRLVGRGRGAHYELGKTRKNSE